MTAAANGAKVSNPFSWQAFARLMNPESSPKLSKLVARGCMLSSQVRHASAPPPLSQNEARTPDPKPPATTSRRGGTGPSWRGPGIPAPSPALKAASWQKCS
eukprot:CAMPEP_0204385242 /NCGR_PEP_ID=MMETSP0469-20131031/57552_1 /ASSEMBLY_ACC=CAM_ASM_000384 /TAXON_ID=2969 /ORGANISM="Oxyrrhis marina" /LENGTH=101 /DNA_ID=CAMNT_0051378127 /DNA_START=326 /DNA_END=629 /DNA_ORIENTATION=-